MATGERLRPYALAALTALLLALSVALAVPFLPALTWGVALAIIAWPLNSWLRNRITANRTCAAVVASAVVILLVAIPSGYVAQQVAREVSSSTEQAQQEAVQGALRERLLATPVLRDAVAWAERPEVNLEGEAKKAAREYLGNGMWLARGSVAILLQLAIAIYILYYSLRDGDHFLRAARRLLPVTPEEADRVFDRAGGSVHANLYASLVTSAINGVNAALLFWATGLPAPILWGVVVFVVSMLPVAGIFLIWLPAAAYLALTDHWGGAVALVAWGVGSSVLVDTLLYTWLAGGRMRLHPVPALLSFIGGLALFGASGIVLGPAILAVTVAVLDVWHTRATNNPLPPVEGATSAGTT
ncbi:AI-2E family transporter [Gemmata sp. JC673]|uniref:AI-2E family transporter n=1 Tax=Gemmata algarum TaxID=2975278 RepID=A0ABU5EXM5_9BACT|nr:AI-2E family transporter [Gemmata algarum]MDY3559921.1 AI-2E family transporter [Gemmata algarum]